MATVTFRKGLLPKHPDSRDLKLSNYWDYTNAVSGFTTFPTITYGNGELARELQRAGGLGMLLNDRIGDCFPADTMHTQQVLAALGGHEPLFNDSSVARTYTELTGWNGKANDPSDTGVEPRAGLRYMQQKGMLDAYGKRHKIGAYLWLEAGDPYQLEAGLKEFEVGGVGLDLTQNAEDEFATGEWRYVPGSPDVGGHWVGVCGGEGGGSFDTLTWGAVINMRRQYYERKCTCAAVWLSHADLNGEGKSPQGFDFEKLRSDLEALKA